MTPHRIRIGWPIAAAALLLSSAAAHADDQQTPQEAAVAALEAKCEAEREARIKPLRDMEIAKCKKTWADHDDPGYCERFWKDYGNAVRIPNGAMTPRMFDDLPDCVAAFKARKALINDNGNPS
jgi:hypothetical protein